VISRYLALLALLCIGTGFSSPEGKPPNRREAAPTQIRVGPNVLVSRDSELPHVELMLAASPRTVSNLLGGAIAATPQGGTACRAYSSMDGGLTWKASDFPEQIEFGGFDPQVAFSARGTALFVGLTAKKNRKGKPCMSMHVWRSEDGGKTWLPSTEIPCNPSWDHEQIVVDQTAGRIYIVALYGYPVYRVGAFRSNDDGRTWTGPVEAANGGGEIGINGVTPMVLSDGALVVPYVDFPLSGKRPAKGIVTSNLSIVISSDGGLTFSKPSKVVGQQVEASDSTTPLSGFPKFATSGASRSFPDRLYVVWEDKRVGAYRILFSRSTDRGRTWSAARPIDTNVPLSTHQYQPAIAVNRDGVLAVTWFDTRESPGRTEYHEYFAASIDGVERGTFSSGGR
jgi:hypothetical protein